MSSLADAVAAGDLDALIRLVDGLASTRDWSGIVELRDRCRHALEERGLQLWPAAEYAEFRLALDAPGDVAAGVVETEAGRFALGPLWEVAASSHTWADLRDHLPAGPTRALCAHDRVLRGEDLESDDSIDREVLEIPLRLQAWEPDYPVATYRSDEADFPAPDPVTLVDAELGGPIETVEDDESTEALFDLGATWARQSNGRSVAAAVAGGAADAIAALGHERCRWAEVGRDRALALAGWAAASGGAYGRRRGSAVGRFAAWWMVSALADLSWPADPTELGAAAGAMRWFVWEPSGAAPGWSACLAVESEESGLSWALEAHDRHREDPSEEG